jgi:pantetheine-phosphate adenylyltransferase
MARRLGICPGTFDPITNGHVGIIHRALSLFDDVIVAVTINLSKAPLFSVAERVAMIEASFEGVPRLTVETLDGLLAQYARDKQATAIVRGLRAPSDFEYELQMAQMNRHLNGDLDTVFLAAEADGSYVSSSLVREVAKLGGDVSDLVPSHVNARLLKRFSS